MNDDIEKADKIVGINDYLRGVLGGSSTSKAMNTLRRGAYFEWLDEKHACGLGPGAPLADIAAEVIRIDADERRKKEPDDGLPPGPWIVHEGMSPAHTTFVPRSAISANRREFATFSERAQADYFARCGSPAVRRLLAAFDVTEEPCGSLSRTLLLANDGNIRTAFGHVENESPVCWLTPRSKP